jgi:ABC-type transport system involved in cytochrome bd biosynthesis fused ATPase/permease subunit
LWFLFYYLRYLTSAELDDGAVERELMISCDGRIAVQVKDGVFAWDDEDVLRGINLEIQGGALAAVVGMVGSGKSSLLGCILGETSKISGKVYHAHMHHQPTTPTLYTFNEREPLVFKCMKFVWFTAHLFTHSPLSQLFLNVHDTCLIFSFFLSRLPATCTHEYFFRVNP